MRKEVAFILLLAVAVLALLSFSSRFGQASEADARKFFTEDMAANYPGADLREILTSAQVGEGAGAYYLLKARVSYNLSTPCPTRLEVEYYYPPQSFVRRAPQQLVGGCQVCAGSSRCVLSYPEEAIIASHTGPDAESVRAYLQAHPSAKPVAHLLDAWQDERNVWQVDWADGTGEGLSVFLSQPKGRVMSVQNLAPSS